MMQIYLNLQGEKFGPNGSIGEIDFQLDNFHIEATVQNGGKLKQIVRHMTNEVLNPNGKPAILIGPNYKNSTAVKAIEDTGATVVHSIEDLIGIIK
ncbi:hypothetical protein [Apibacter sp. HY039]|uniref:hypothetical protein n=1 Tax=Apibacter sp. HY039 TaxID=2501476 RepID=UPI000FEB6D1C|nr:hypothetical protein [Apibacter sp. HY039]